MGQRLPARLRIALTRSPGAAWLRRLSQMPRSGAAIVLLNGALSGYRMRLDMRAGHRRYALGTYEPEVVALIQSTLQGGETVMDIGANIGYFTLLMAHRVGAAGRVIAFEPVPSVYAVLCENLRLNACSQAQAECKAVADVEGTGAMQSDLNNPLSFVGQLSDVGELAVPLVSIDRYVETAGLQKLDLVKIDVEGAEDRVIRGMTKTLKTLHPTVLVEIHANDGRTSEGLKRLQEAGYRLTRVEPAELAPCDALARGGYVLAR
jgi:FkbM family methyltransferase